MWWTLDDVCVCMLVTQSCLTFCDPVNCSPPASFVQAILQARILEWVAISFSRGSSQPRDQTWVSCIVGGFFTIWPSREGPWCGWTSSNQLKDVGAEMGTLQISILPQNCNTEILPEFATCRLLYGFRTYQPHNCMTHFLKINHISVYSYMHVRI